MIAPKIDDIVKILVYEFINLLFVLKYSPLGCTEPMLVSIIFVVGINLLLFAIWRFRCDELPRGQWDIIFGIFTISFAIALASIILNVNPREISVTRFPAINDWLGRLLHGQFPYGSDKYPSSFPFLFILALPFYLMGDAGFMQVAAFLAFAYLIRLKHREHGLSALKCIMLLMIAPIFLYEVSVRSELFSNMVAVMLFLAAFERYGKKENVVSICAWGLLGGLLLSTRGIVIIIYCAYFVYVFRAQIWKAIVFLLCAATGFAATILPFYLWRSEFLFIRSPFLIQTAATPLWLPISALAAAVICALMVKSQRGIYSTIAFVLFGVIFSAFLIEWIAFGLRVVLFADIFDISYFAFAMPFILYSAEL